MMGLFKKGACCLCGGKTGLMDKKCLSGKVCKNCAKKMSPWFDNYKGMDKASLFQEKQMGIGNVVLNRNMPWQAYVRNKCKQTDESE
jgi:hypothetical protein